MLKWLVSLFTKNPKRSNVTFNTKERIQPTLHLVDEDVAHTRATHTIPLSDEAFERITASVQALPGIKLVDDKPYVDDDFDGLVEVIAGRHYFVNGDIVLAVSTTYLETVGKLPKQEDLKSLDDFPRVAPKGHTYHFQGRIWVWDGAYWMNMGSTDALHYYRKPLLRGNSVVSSFGSQPQYSNSSPDLLTTAIVANAILDDSSSRHCSAATHHSHDSDYGGSYDSGSSDSGGSCD